MTTVQQQVALIAAAQHGTFRLDQIGDLSTDLARRRVDRFEWRRHAPGVFSLAGSPDTWERRLWIELHQAGPGATVGRRSAARLHRLPGSSHDHTDVVRPEPGTPRSRTRTMRRSSRLPDGHVTIVRGFPVTTVARTLFDLAGLTSPQRRRRGWVYLPAKRVERMVDDALNLRLTSLHRLGVVLFEMAGRGRPGTTLMREILDARAPGYVATASELEDLFLRLVDAYALPMPRRQVDLGSEHAHIGRVDFVYDGARLVVELDGRKHHDSLAMRVSDQKRDLRLAAEGWRVVRIGWWQLVREPGAVAELLHRALGHGPAAAPAAPAV